MKGKSFKYSLDNILKNLKETAKAEPCIDAYLKKAKQNNKDSLILKGYFYSGYLSNYEAALAYNYQKVSQYILKLINLSLNIDSKIMV